MVQCELCQTQWDDVHLMTNEGLQHFYQTGKERQIVDPSGKVWVVVYGKDKSIVGLKQCRCCPAVSSSGGGDAN